MKFYLFLSNLLFGITLLTFAVAVSHFLGIILIKRLPHMPIAVKKQFRFLLLFAFISISMFLFFGKLIGVGAHSLRFADEARITEGLVPRLIQSQVAKESSFVETPISLEQSITLFNPEVESESEKYSSLGLSMRFISSAKDDVESDDCSRWYQFLQTRGIRMERKYGIKTLTTAKTPAMICLSNDINEDQLRFIEQWVFNGGQIFFAGRSTTAHSDSISKILGIDSFQSPEKTLGSTLIFGGPYLNFGTTGGRKISLGNDWINARGFPVARSNSGMNSGTAGAYLMNEGVINELSPLIFSSYGKGRALWTSLPPMIYGKLSILNESLWKQWQKVAFNYIFDLPTSGINARVLEKSPIKTLAIHAEYKINQILKLIPVLKENHQKASAFFIYSETAESPEVVETWLQAGNEVGYSFINHQAFKAKTFFETKDQLKQLSNFVKKNNFGLMLFPGINATTDSLAAALELNFKYVLGDPFSDQLSSFSLAPAPTKDLVALYPNANKINTFPVHTNHLKVLATPLGDDFIWPIHGSEAEIHAKMDSIDQIYSWSGVGTVYKVHSQNLKIDPVYESIISTLNEKNNSKWLSTEELIQRSEILNQITVNVLQKGLQSASVVIKNNGSEPILNPTIKVIAGQRWSLENGTQVDEKFFNSKVVTHWEMELPRLNPGEQKIIPLRYR